MSEIQLSVREIEEGDFTCISDYWIHSDPVYLQNMGVDLSKIPSKDKLNEMLYEQIDQSYENKKSYCLIWQVENKSIGHSNVNKIVFGKEAYMHLHIWDVSFRKKGYGSHFVKTTLPYFFNNLKLSSVFCEPYALNPSPNKTLERVGFKFIKEYVTTPGYLNFEQSVKRWEMKYEDFIIQNK